MWWAERVIASAPPNSCVFILSASSMSSAISENLHGLKERLKKNGVEIDHMIIEDKEAPPPLSQNEAFETIVLFDSPVTSPESIYFDSFISALKPKGKLYLVFEKLSVDAEELRTFLLLRGLLDPIEVPCPPEVKDVNTLQFYEGAKPDWEVGASAAVSVNLGGGGGGTSASTWKIAALNEDGDDLVDEDDLLDAAPLPANISTGGGCGDEGSTKPKRACKNCTCGLAEELAGGGGEGAAPPAPVDPVAKSSACGNCFKGDAFRCASCPFRGKPSFKPGEEKLVLDLGSDDV